MKKVAIIIPCYNEEMTIQTVIHDCQMYAPYAKVYVIDNASTDSTKQIAEKNNAIVLSETRRGKAYAIRKAFQEIDADVYVMIDGDNTYPLSEIHRIVDPILQGEADMTVGDRHADGSYQRENKRKFHFAGNSLIKKTINLLFGSKLNDILSGYRGFSKRFVKNYPLLCHGFELEADLTIHALHYRYHIKEIPIPFKERPEGSHSKLATFSDGFKIITLIIELFKDNKPMVFFSFLSSIVLIVALLSGMVVINEFTHSGFITHLPLTILSSSSLVLSFLLFISGLILDTLRKQDLRQHALLLLRDQS